MSFHEEPHTPQLWRKLFFFFCFSPAIRVVCCLCVGCFDLALFFCWKTKENRWKRCRPARSCGSATVTRRKRSGRCVFAASPSTTAAKKKNKKKLKKKQKKRNPRCRKRAAGSGWRWSITFSVNRIYFYQNLSSGRLSCHQQSVEEGAGFWWIFNWVLPSFTEFHWVWQDFLKMDYTGFDSISIGFIGIFWVLLGFTEFHWVWRFS